MYVSIVKTEPYLKGSDLSGVSCILYIPINEINNEDTGLKIDPDTLLFEATDKYFYVWKYTEQLEIVSKKFDMPIALLHAYIEDGTDLLDQGNLNKRFIGILYNAEYGVLHGDHCGNLIHVKLSDPKFEKDVAELCIYYNKCKSTTIQGLESFVSGVYCGDRVAITGDMESYITDHNYDICHEIYKEIKKFRDDTDDDGVHMEVPNRYGIRFDLHNPWATMHSDIVIKNMNNDKFARIGGLNYNRITSMLIKTNNGRPSYQTRDMWFASYVRVSLNLIGLYNLGVNSLYKTIVTSINMYKGVNFEDVDSFDPCKEKLYPNVRVTMEDYTSYDENTPKDARWAGCTIGQLPKIQGTIDKDYGGAIEDDCVTTISMNDLKWLLLYIMDMVIRESYTTVSHALPVYVYKNGIGKLSASFNHIEASMDDLEEYGTFHTFRSKYKVCPISDIMSYYDSSKMYEYKRIIGTRPDIRIIFDDDIFIN